MTKTMNMQITPNLVTMCNGFEIRVPESEHDRYIFAEDCLARTHTFVTSRTMADLCDMAAHLFKGQEYDLFALVTCANGTFACIAAAKNKTSE